MKRKRVRWVHIDYMILYSLILIRCTIGHCQDNHVALDKNLLLLNNVYSNSIDTICVSESIIIHSIYDETFKCGSLTNGIKTGKWITYDSNGRPDYIQYYTLNGKDSIGINLIETGSRVGSITIHYARIYANYCNDYLEEIVWYINDSTKMEYVFYYTGDIKQYGEVYTPYYPWLKSLLPFDVGGKDKEWTYLDEKGNIIKKEIWDKGQLLKTENFQVFD